MMQQITFITGNAGKAEQVSRYLKMPVEHRKLDLIEIQSLDLAEVVADKARRAFEQIGAPVLVEDTSLAFGALGRLPGPLIKWFFEELSCDGLCKLVDGYDDRSALATALFGYYDGKQLLTLSGELPGVIAAEPRGNNGFGWDPVFIPDGDGNPGHKTFAEMTPDEATTNSLRKHSLEKLKDALS
jgi:non-canonical purine NTP pyrophosphatase (RdgB/HAM1 family)